VESFEAFIKRIEELLDRVDDLDDEAREDVYELLDGIDTLHRQGVEALASALDSQTLARIRENDAVAWLLDAYGAQTERTAGSMPIQIKRKP
jgi:DNA-directed RNA polymerase beta' subunit